MKIGSVWIYLMIGLVLLEMVMDVAEACNKPRYYNKKKCKKQRAAARRRRFQKAGWRGRSDGEEEMTDELDLEPELDLDLYTRDLSEMIQSEVDDLYKRDLDHATKEKIKKSLADRFNEEDDNKDGKLQWIELWDPLAKHCRNKDIKDMAKFVDCYKSISLVQQMEEEDGEENVTEYFRKYGAARNAEAHEQFNFDLNNDGHVTKKEFKKAHKALMKDGKKGFDLRQVDLLTAYVFEQ